MSRTSLGIGSVALATMLNPWPAMAGHNPDDPMGGILINPHFTPKVRRIIYLFQSGGPSHLDLFDYKPKLAEMNGEQLPESVRKGQRLTGMTAYQKSFPAGGLALQLFYLW